MVNLVAIFVAGIAIGHGNPVKDDVGRDAGQFAVDQRGKFVVYKSNALADEVSFPAVQEQLTAFLDAKGNETTTKSAGRLESTGSVSMKKHAGIGNYVAGKINYTLVLENSEGELNYWFTDLSYQPYRNDRYGKRIKATVAPIPLEDQFSKLNERIWAKQKNYAYEALDELANQVLGQLEAAGRPKVVTTNME
ncbi:hypothetical protein GCM10007415_23990 [Parapedobacter pyrenivorans]|uniref:DUF4468 domain-containing protein n=1 Tax=Parapedobacter pyrenivorans TaxID=1305674 RepID=A0A917HSQ4_9SPHI|nr:hypothetical protein [Parapedobacter pyrenivorans]GGG89078.1 hypothetical protein GCM10007415_23990 [Parapedobacter pyrenivorans]